MRMQPFYFLSVPHYILGLVFLSLTRQFLFEYRVHDYNTPEALHWTRPGPCTGALLLTARILAPSPAGRTLIEMLPAVLKVLWA